MHPSRFRPADLLGIVAAILLVASLVFLEWFSLTLADRRPDQFLCGVGEFSCTGWETFPILRWLLVAGATAPFILAYIVLRRHELSWPPGELTMVVGFTAFVLVAYNGIVERPGAQPFGIGLSLGYWLAIASTLLIAFSGAWRMTEHMAARKPPGNL